MIKPLPSSISILKIKRYLLVGLLVFWCGVSWGQTTYTWNNASGGSWGTAGNWTPSRTTPATTDILVFNSGTSVVVVDVPQNQKIGKLQVTNNNTIVTLRPVSNKNATLTITAIASDALLVAAGSKLIITGRSTSRTLTVTSNAVNSFQINGILETGFDGTATAAAGTLLKGTATILFNSGSKYIHNRNAGSIPISTWDANSTTEITGVTTTGSTNMNQNFGNVIFNSPNMSVNMSIDPLRIFGSFTIQNGGSGSLRQNSSFIVNGNVSFLSGNYFIAPTAARTLTVAGNYTQTGGTLDMGLSTFDGTIAVAGNFSQTGGTITKTSTGIGFISLNGGGPTQTFTSGGTFGSAVNWNIAANSPIQTADASTIFGGTGTFTINSGATFGIRATDGIATTGSSGHIRSTGTRIFDPGANYIFNGNTNQNGNPNFPASANTIRIENTGSAGNNTITWERSVTLGGDLLVNQGNLDLDTFTLDRGTAGGTFSLGAGLKLTVGGADNFPKNYTTYTIPCSSIVEYDGTLNQTLAGRNYGELIIGGSGNKTFSAGTTSICSNLTFQGNAISTGIIGFSVGGNVLIAAGSTFIPGAFIYQVGGNWTRNGTFTSAGSTVDFNGSNPASIGVSNFQNVLFSGAGAKTATGALTIAGNVSITSNFTAGAFTHTVGGNWTKAGTFTSTGSTIDFNGTNPGSIGASNFNNLTFSGSGTKTATGILTATGNIAITNNFSAGAFSHTLSGNWTSTAASFTPGTSTITFNGSIAQTIAASANSFYNLTLNNTAGLITSNTFSITNQLILDAGTLVAGTNLTMGVASTIRRRGTGTSTGMTGAIQGSNAYDVIYEIGSKSTGSEISGTGLRDVTLAMSASTTLTATGNVSLSRLLTIPTGNTLNMSTFPLTKPGLTTSGAGTLITNNTSTNPIPIGVSWSFLVRYANLTGDQKVVFGTYSGLDLSGTSGTVTLAQTGEGNITIGSGQFTLSGSQTYVVTGSTIVFNAAAAQTLPGITFNNVTLNGSGDKTLSTATNISGIFSIAGTAVAKLGDTNRTVGLLLLNNVIQSTGSYGSTASAATNKISQYFGTTGTGVINVTSVCIDGEWLGTTSSNWFDPTNWCGGIPDLDTDVVIHASTPNQPTIGANGAITRSLLIETGATLTISGAFTINVEGNWVNSGTFVPGASTVNFSGTGTALIGASNFNQVIISGTGVKSANGSINPLGNFTINSGATFVGGTFTHSIGGNFSNSGTFTSETSTIKFSSGTPSVTGSVTSNFYNLEINGGANLSLASNTQVSNALNLTWGTLTASTRLTMAVNSQINRAGTAAAPTSFTGTIQGSNAYDVNYSGENKTTGSELSGAGLRNLTLALSSANTLTAGNNISHAGTLTVPSGNTLAMSTFSLTNSTLITSGLGLLTTQNTGTTPLPAGKTWSFPINYSASTGAQKIVYGTYNGLTASNTSGTNTLAPISDGGEIVIATGNFTASGTYTTTGSTVRFSAAGAQSVPGIAFNNLILDGSGDKTFSGTSNTAGTLTIISGVIAKLGNVNHTANSLTLGTQGQPDGTFGSSASGASFKISSSFGTTGSGILTVASSNCTPGLWLGYVSTDWNDAANWCGPVPSSTTDVTISASALNQPIIGSAGAIARNITIQTGATLAFSGAFNLEIYGNWTNNGTFTPNLGRVTFKGSGNQTFGGSSSTSIYRLIIEKASADQLTLNSNLTITNSLTLTSGTLTAGTRLTMGTNSLLVRRGITGATTSFTGTIQGSSNYDLTYEGNSKSSGGETTGGGLRDITLNVIASNEVTVSANISHSRNLAIPAGMTFNMAGFTLSNPNLATSGTGLLKTSSTAAPPLPRGKTWTFEVNYTNTTGGQQVVYGVYNALKTLNTSGIATLDPISAGGEIEIASGSFTASGSVTSTGSKVNFSASVDQNIPAITFADLILQGTGSKNFSGATSISGNLTITGSAIARLGSGVTHTSASLTLGSQGQPNGSFGSTASAATYKVVQYFGTIGTGILNVGNSTCISGSWLGYSSTAWTTTTNWCGGTPGTTTAVTIPGGSPNQPLISAADVSILSMNIESGATLTMSSARTLTLAEDWLNDGNFIPGDGKVLFNSSLVVQVISGTGTNKFFNLEMNKAADIELSIGGPVSLAGKLTLVIGDFNAQTNFTPLVNSTIDVTNGTFAGTIQGNNAYDVTYLGVSKTTGAETSGTGLRNITLSLTSSNILTSGSAFGLSGILNIPSTQNLAMSTFALSGAFTTSGTGTLTTANTSTTPLTGGKTWTFPVNYNAATGAQKVVHGIYNGLSVTNTSGTTNFAPQTEGTIEIASGNLTLTGAGTKTASDSRLSFSATAAQTIPALTYRNIVLAGSGDKTLAGTITVTENFSISGTAVAKLLNVNHTAISLTLGGVSQPASTYGSTASTAFYKFELYFGTTGTGILTTSTGGCVPGTWLGTTSSDWNTASNWCGGIPALTSDVTIPSGTPFSPSIDVAGGKTLSITIASGATLAISGAGLLEVAGNWANNGTFSPGTTSTVEFNGTATSTINSGPFAHVTFSGTGSKTASVGLTIAGNVSITNNFASGGFTHTVGGNWINTGTFTATGSTVDFNGGSAASIGISNFENVTFSGAGTKTAAGALIIAGNVSVANNFTAGAFTHSVGGNWTRAGTFTATGSTVDFNRGSAASIGISNFENVTFSGAGTKTAAGALTIAGNVSVANNFTAGAFTHTVGGNWNKAGTFTATSSTIDFNGASAASIGTSNFENVTFSGGGVKTAAGLLTIAGNVSVANNFTAGAFTHTVGGNWTKAGTFTATGSTIDFNGASAASIGTSNFENLTFSGAGVKTATGALTITGNVSVANNFTAGSFTHTVGGNWTRAGTFTATGSTIEFNGANAASIGTSNFENLTFSGAGVKTATGALTITGNVSIANNFTAGSFTHTVGGNWTRAGTFTATGSTIEFNGANAASIGTSNFQNVTFSGAGAKTATGVLSIAGNVSLANNFNGGAVTHTVGGNWSNSGTFTPATSTITFNANGTQSISSSTFYNLKLIGSGDKSFLISTAIANNFEIEGTAVARLGGVNHTANKLFLGATGQAASSYGSTASTAIFKIAQYFGSTDAGILNVATSAVVCTNGIWLGATSSDWNNDSNWCNSIIPDLTLDVIIPSTAPIQPIIGIAGAKAKSLTIHAGAILTISGAGLLEVAGNWTNNGTFNPGTTSTVEFKGAANSSINAGSFANLSFTGTGTKTINGTLTVSGNITPVSTPVILSDLNSLTLNTGKTMEILASGSFTTSGASSKVILAPGSNYLNRSTSNPRLEILQLFTGSKGWRLIGAPLTSTYASMTTGFVTQGFPGSTNPSLQPNLLWWDETDKGTTLQGWRQPSNLSNSVPAGRGHYFFVFNGAAKPSSATGNYADVLPLTMSITGTEVNLASANFNFGVTFTARNTNLVAQADTLIEVNQADEGFNLIANPTASMLDWDAGSGWTKTNMDASIYVWDPTTTSFLVWNGSIGTLENGVIAPYQGFWVRSNAESPTLQLTGNGAKTLTNKAFYGRTMAPEKPSVIHLQVNGENLQAESFISFGADGLEGVDPKDAYQLESLAEDWLLLYTYGSINKKTPLVINHLNPLDGNEKVIPLHLAASKSGKPINGSYLMNWTLPTDLPSEVTVVLMDHISKKAIDMRKESAYSFSFEAPQQSNARIGKSFDPLAIPQAVIFQSPYETGEVSPNARKVAEKPQRPFTIFISGKATGEIGYLADLPKLFGPVPNPFIKQTKIKFYLPETQKAEIQITDMLGQVIGSFPSEEYKAGIHELEWIPSAIQIPHGMYMIRLTTENYQMSQKLIKN